MLDHLGVQVGDVEASLAFYVRTFAGIGLREVMRFPAGTRSSSASPDAGGVPDFWLSPAGGAETRELHVGFRARTARRSMRSTPPPSRPARRCCTPRGSGRSTTPATTRSSCGTPTGTTSRPSSTAADVSCAGSGGCGSAPSPWKGRPPSPPWVTSTSPCRDEPPRGLARGLHQGAPVVRAADLPRRLGRADGAGACVQQREDGALQRDGRWRTSRLASSHPRPHRDRPGHRGRPVRLRALQLRRRRVTG